MHLLHPWMLLGFHLVPVAVLLHVFRVPGRRHEVSDLSLWQKVLSRVHPEAAQRTRRLNWLLILEILIISLLVFGLAGPVVVDRRPSRHIGFIVDTSASMNIMDADGTSRWQKALDKIEAILGRLGGDDLVSLTTGPTPTVSLNAATPDEVTRELRGMEPGHVAAEPGRVLADGIAFFADGPDAIFHVSDHAIPDDDENRRLREIVVGRPTRNVGIVGFDVAPAKDGSYEAFVRVVNASAEPVSRTLLVTGASGNDKRIALTIPAKGSAEQVVSVRLTTASPIVRIRLEGESDGFALDDEVAAVLAPLPVVVTGESVNPAYSRLFGGNVFENTLYIETTDKNLKGLPENALVISLGRLPTLLGKTTAVVNPPSGELTGIVVGDEKSRGAEQALTAVNGSDLLRKVSLSELRLDTYRPLTLPEGATPILQMGRDVVAARLDTPRGRLVVLSFDGDASGWPLKQSFVVFWANVLDDARKRSLAGGVGQHPTGSVVRFRAPGAELEIDTPTGPRRITRGPDGWASVHLDRVGIYALRDRSRQFAANLVSEMESASRVETPYADDDLPAPTPRGMMWPLGPWLCALAAVLAVVWWRFRR